jgi:fructose-1,6-bisphosphatase/sedoheptulose 1,7-bisphosphatase-like protein
MGGQLNAPAASAEQAAIDMALNPQLTQAVTAVVQRAAAAPHGQKGAIYAAACAELGVSLQTLHAYMKRVAVKPARKQRADAGDVSLPRDEAALISAYLMVSHRKTGKRLMSMGPGAAAGQRRGACPAHRPGHG